MNYAIITGASKGIGKEIAEELAKRKYNLVLIARSETALNDVCDYMKKKYSIDAKYLAIDLSSIDSHETIFKWVEENKLPINVLVNNAGYGLWGKFDELTLEEQTNMMQLNMVTMVKMTHLFLPLLKIQDQSYIMNVASTAAYQAIAGMNVYSATKSFVILFSRALKLELKDTSVSVTCLSPGTTESNFMNRAGITTKEMIKRAEKVIMKADDVARFAVDGMLKKKNEIIPGFLNKISVAITYYAPKWLTEKIAEGLYKK